MTKRNSITMVDHLRAQEREQCAKIAEQVGIVDVLPADDFERGFHSAAEQIAAAIRSDGEKARED
jgi:hypothetical protein